MEINNNLPDFDTQDPINSSQLSYEENIDVGETVSNVTDKTLPKEGQCVLHEALALKTTPKP